MGARWALIAVLAVLGGDFVVMFEWLVVWMRNGVLAVRVDGMK